VNTCFTFFVVNRSSLRLYFAFLGRESSLLHFQFQVLPVAPAAAAHLFGRFWRGIDGVPLVYHQAAGRTTRMKPASLPHATTPL